MNIVKVCNFINCEKFNSKDGSKTFYNASFLADDTVLNCQFIKKEDFDILVKGQRLAPVEVQFSLEENGTDSNGNKSYRLRLIKVNGWCK